MNKYYFYGSFNSPDWYAITVDMLRHAIDRGRNNEGKIIDAFSASFIFMGVYTEAPDKETAKQYYFDNDNLLPAKEPACMLMARREFFAGVRETHHTFE